MYITLQVTDGPGKGLEFSFNRHDTFLVGRSKHAHFQLPLKDKFCSRIHFMVEMNPPACRLVDMGSHNGTFVNGQKVLAADLKDGDKIRAGHTMLSFKLQLAAGEALAPAWQEGSGESVALGGEAEPTPDRIPGYRLGDRLGVGLIGAVYAATRKRDGARVALKVILPAVAGTASQVEAFLREAASLTALDHPHIVRLLEMGAAEGVLFFAMEFVPGTDAASLLKKQGPLAERRAVRLVCQVLEALEYAHARGIIHRDIKPGNLLLTGEEGKEIVKLTDLGLARIYQNSPLSGLSVTRNIASSAPYMPPELITNYKQAAPTSDQYAAAATLYVLLTGQPVYDFPKEDRLHFSLLLEQQPVPIRQRRPGISEAVAAVIHKALQRNPANRYVDVKTFRQALIRAVKK